MSEKFYWDYESKKWRHEEIVHVVNGEEEHFDEYDEHLWLDESARSDYETARILTVGLISRLILFQICHDKELIDQWNSEISNLIRQFKTVINKNENDDLQSRIDENLDIIYDDAMIYVLEEVGNSIENGESEKFFEDEISEEIRSEILKAYRLMKSNRRIPNDFIGIFKEYLNISEKSPWIVADFLKIKLPEDFREMTWVNYSYIR